jgi:hypothetical protein
MDLLKLIALDEDDLKVLSANLQDAILTVEDMTFLPKERRFAAVMKRFNWLGADEKRGGNGSGYERRACALRFENVKHAQLRNLALDRPGDALELLAIAFEPSDPPSGLVTLIFAGQAAIRLHVDCIEAELRDLGPCWLTSCRPSHPDKSQKQKIPS